MYKKDQNIPKNNCCNVNNTDIYSEMLKEITDLRCLILGSGKVLEKLEKTCKKIERMQEEAGLNTDGQKR